MGSDRRHLDCRRIPHLRCSLVLSGESREVEQAAIEHGQAAHGASDSLGLRAEVRAELDEILPLVPSFGRRSLECRDLPDSDGCSLSFNGPEADVVAAALGHLIRFHRSRPSADLVDRIRHALRSEPATTFPYPPSP